MVGRGVALGFIFLLLVLPAASACTPTSQPAPGYAFWNPVTKKVLEVPWGTNDACRNTATTSAGPRPVARATEGLKDFDGRRALLLGPSRAFEVVDVRDQSRTRGSLPDSYRYSLWEDQVFYATGPDGTETSLDSYQITTGRSQVLIEFNPDLRMVALRGHHALFWSAGNVSLYDAAARDWLLASRTPASLGLPEASSPDFLGDRLILFRERNASARVFAYDFERSSAFELRFGPYMPATAPMLDGTQVYWSDGGTGFYGYDVATQRTEYYPAPSLKAPNQVWDARAGHIIHWVRDLVSPGDLSPTTAETTPAQPVPLDADEPAPAPGPGAPVALAVGIGLLAARGRRRSRS